MDNISIEGTERSPQVAFDFDNHSFLLKGESYPEDVTAFYGPVIGDLEEYLNALSGGKVHFTFELIYFNSSTAKVLMGLFEILDEAAADNDVLITWAYEEDDDNMEEMGDEFGEDLEKAKFELKKITI